MGVQRYSKRLLQLHTRKLSTSTHNLNSRLANASEYVETPQYPDPVPSYRCKTDRLQHEWYNNINRLPTIEQKLMEMNMPKYFGFGCALIKDEMVPFSSYEFLKFITRTQLIDGLPPDYYSNLSETVERVLPNIRDQVKEVILLQYGNNIFRDTLDTTKIQKEDQSFFIQNINSICMHELNKESQSLKSAVTHIEPRIENFWFVGGFEPASQMKKQFEKIPVLQDFKMNKYFRGTTRPCLAIRIPKALPEAVSHDDILSKSPQDIPIKPIPPDNYGYPIKSRRAVLLPGFWPGEQNEHSLLFWHSRHLLSRFTNLYGLKYYDIGLRNWILGANFVQALAFAFFQGMNPVADVKDPFAQQSIFTDGQKFTFSLYQLNTTVLHDENHISNARNNILWKSEDMSLFETIEDGKVKGFNDDVLRLIISMYLKEGQKEYPLPAHGYKYLKDHDRPQVLKEEFMKILQHVLSERPKGKHRPEIYMWERIYMIQFKTRPRDGGRIKYWDSWKNKPPHTRRLDEYTAAYIPKKRRIDMRVDKMPRIHSEKLFKYDRNELHRVKDLLEDNILYQTLNKNKIQYRQDPMWDKKEEETFFWKVK